MMLQPLRGLPAVLQGLGATLQRLANTESMGGCFAGKMFWFAN